jgi:hypothetical protein
MSVHFPHGNPREQHMQITDILAQTGGLQSMARELGISEQQAASGAGALLPAILGGFKKQAPAQGGLGGLGDLLGQLGGGGLMDQVLAPEPTDPSAGNDVLGQVFGSKDVSRTVAQNAASQTGLSPDLLKKMLPILAMLVTGYLARQGAGASQQQPSDGGLGGLGGLLGGLLGGQAGGAGGGGAGGGAGGGLGSMLDLNGDGNPLDDILNMAGKALR